MTREDAIKTLKELWRETNDPWYEEVYDMAINALEADRKTEPQKKCHRDEEYACHLYPNESVCNNCKLWYEDEPQTCETCKFEIYCPEMCEGCCEWDSHYEPKDEPQTERRLPDYSYEADLGRRIIEKTMRDENYIYEYGNSCMHYLPTLTRDGYDFTGWYNNPRISSYDRIKVLS